MRGLRDLSLLETNQPELRGKLKDWLVSRILRRRISSHPAHSVPQTNRVMASVTQTSCIQPVNDQSKSLRCLVGSEDAQMQRRADMSVEVGSCADGQPSRPGGKPHERALSRLLKGRT